jgi:hypothetical protein
MNKSVAEINRMKQEVAEKPDQLAAILNGSCIEISATGAVIFLKCDNIATFFQQA